MTTRRESRPGVEAAPEDPAADQPKSNLSVPDIEPDIEPDVTNLTAALAYAEAGHAVFGLKPGAKEPYGRTRGFKDASTDSGTVAQWWNLVDRDDGTVYDSNIAIRPAPNVFVLDVDVRGDGYATLADRVIQLGALPENAPVAVTPSRGLHIWLSYNGDGELVDSLGPGLDVKANDGYLVVPPSVIENAPWEDPKPEGTYRWRVPLTGTLPPTSPSTWREAARKPEPRVRPKTERHNVAPFAVNITDDRKRAIASGALNKATAKLAATTSNRDNAKRDALWDVCKFLKDDVLTFAEVKDAMTEAFRANGLDVDRANGGLTRIEKDIKRALDNPKLPSVDWERRLRDQDIEISELTTATMEPANACETNGEPTTWEPDDDETEPTTWEPFDLGPYLRGEIERPQPSIGIVRSDGVRVIYPSREHAVLGETESGKTWFALGCVVSELLAGHHVVYIHYEEADATSTIERLRLLGVADAMIESQFRFVAPMKAARKEWLAELLAPAPSLVVHDGINEAMSLHGADIMAADGAATFRRNLIMPCTRAGAATLACDHLPKDREKRGRDAYGSVHKGNALDGARIVLENREPFGRGLRGVSYVFVTKDRPGFLRINGRPTKTPGKTFMGALVVDDSRTFEPFEMPFYAPSDGDGTLDGPGGEQTAASAELADIVHQMIMALPDRTVESKRRLFAQMRSAGQTFREGAMRDAVDDLVLAGRLVELPGKRKAIGYRAVPSAAQESEESDT